MSQRLHPVPCGLLPPRLRFCHDVTFKRLDLIGGEDRAGTIQHFWLLRGRASSLVRGAHRNVNDPRTSRPKKVLYRTVFRSRAVSEIPGPITRLSDSNIRKDLRRNGMRMLETDHHRASATGVSLTQI